MEKAIVSIPRNSGWKAFLGEKLPPKAKEFLQQAREGSTNKHWNWLVGTVFYRGNIETTNEWIIVTDDGWYYKVRAEFMMWYSRPEYTDHMGNKSNSSAQALWSVSSLKKSLRSVMQTGEITFDPNYQT